MGCFFSISGNEFSKGDEVKVKIPQPCHENNKFFVNDKMIYHLFTTNEMWVNAFQLPLPPK